MTGWIAERRAATTRRQVRWRSAGRHDRRRLTPPMALRLGALVALVTLAACGGGDQPTLAGYQRTPAPNVAALSLPAVEADGSEQSRAFQAADGDLLLVYFGYTSCPDVCPTTLADLRRALDELGPDADKVEVAMVTIDPEIDTPEVLVGYVRSFVPTALALRTLDDSELRAAAAGFGADYGKEEVDEGDGVYHTASLYAVDRSGELLLTWPFGITSSDLRSDLDQLLDRAS